MTSGEFITTVDMPVKARLALLTEDGREVDVTPELLRRFDYVNAYDAADRFRSQLCRVLEVDDLDEDAPEWAIAIREIVSCALFYSHDFDYSAHPEDPENDDTKAAARLTALLRSTASDPSLESIL